MNIVISMVVDYLYVWNKKVIFWKLQFFEKISRVMHSGFHCDPFDPLKTIYSAFLSLSFFLVGGSMYYLKGIVIENRTATYLSDIQ